MIEGTAGLGASLAENLAIVAFVFSQCWQDSRYSQPRRDGILDQEIDKTSLLLLNAIQETDPEGAYFLPSPFTMVPGRHGPGPALIGNDRRPVFICDFIERIQSAFPEAAAFQISRPAGKSRYFEPILTRVSWDRWKTKPNVRVVTFIDQVTDLLKRLSEKNSIAFGRHPSAKDSRKALAFLHSSFQSSLEKLLSLRIETPAEMIEAQERAADLLNIAQSGYAKVVSDPDYYSEARKIVIESDEGAARDAILGCRCSWDEIARDREWRKLAPKSRALYFLAKAINCCLRLNSLSGRGDMQAIEDLKSALDSWASEGAAVQAALQDESLSAGKLVHCAANIRQCVSKVMSSEYTDS